MAERKEAISGTLPWSGARLYFAIFERFASSAANGSQAFIGVDVEMDTQKIPKFVQVPFFRRSGRWLSGTALLVVATGIVSPGYTTLNQRKRILEDGSGDACFDGGYEFIEFGVVQSGGLHDKQGVVVTLLDRSTRNFLDVILFAKFRNHFPSRVFLLPCLCPSCPFRETPS